MKSIKTFLYIVFNIFYPFIVISITSRLLNCLRISNEDIVSAIVISVLLAIPYVYLTFKNKVISSNWYFISENGWLVFFLLVGRYVDSNLKFGYEVWGVAFVLMKMWDSYLKIRAEQIK